jgi:hypothetical protein
VRRVKKVSIVAACAALVAGIVSVAWPASAATTAAGIPITMENSGKCLNVAGASTANNAKVIQYTCVASATNDKWVLVPQAGGVYWVQNVASGKCLTVQGASTTNNALLIQYACTTGDNETWRVESLLDAPTMRLHSTLSGRCLDVPGNSTANNVQLIQYTCQPGDGTANERFTLPPTTSPVTTPRETPEDQPLAVLQGGQPTSGGTAPVTYSWLAGDHEWKTVTDFNPDVFQPDPDAPGPSGMATANAGDGYAGYPTAALLGDKRVQIVAHDQEAGDVHSNDESQPGTGHYGPLVDVGGAMDAQPTIGAYAPGRLAYYAIIGGALWYDPQMPGDTYPAYGGWRSLGGTDLDGVPAVAPNGTGVQIFATSTSGEARTAKLDGTTLSDWTSLGRAGTGQGVGQPIVLPLGGDRYFLVAQTQDNPPGTVLYLKQQADGSWPDNWSQIVNQAMVGEPTAVLVDGRVVVAIHSADYAGSIEVAQETAAGSGKFGVWALASSPTDGLSPIPDGSPTAFTLDLPSGPSFGIAFQPAAFTDKTDPYEILFPHGWTTDQGNKTVRYRAVPMPATFTKK